MNTQDIYRYICLNYGNTLFELQFQNNKIK